MKIVLQRLAPHGTAMFGYFEDAEHRHVCVTLERMDKLIATGVYECKRDWHHPKDIAKRYIVWELQSVANRSDLQIHVANTPSQLLGCIAPGESYGTLDGEPAVLHSGKAFVRFMALTVDAETLTLDIRNPVPV